MTSAKASQIPTPAAIRAAREAAGLTQAQAAALVYGAWRTWSRWESGGGAMHPGLWELFRLKTKDNNK